MWVCTKMDLTGMELEGVASILSGSEWDQCQVILNKVINPLTPNDHYSGRTASLTSKLCILYIYSTNVGTEYFKHVIYSPCFFLFKMQFVS